MTSYDLLCNASVPPGVDLVVFDFGGTIFDFLPVHIESFWRASCMLTSLGVGDNAAAVLVENTVERSIAAGIDSFDIASALLASLGHDATMTGSLVEAKREIVEEMMSCAALTSETAATISRVAERSRVAVVTRGLVASTAAAVKGSLDPILAASIEVFGRRGLSQRVDKEELVRTALNGLSPSRALYVGDADVDERIARTLGTRFWRVMIRCGQAYLAGHGNYEPIYPGG
jgi:phosphoglycolate phosphatase-like HAD superfamily hydrolase